MLPLRKRYPKRGQKKHLRRRINPWQNGLFCFKNNRMLYSHSIAGCVQRTPKKNGSDNGIKTADLDGVLSTLENFKETFEKESLYRPFTITEETADLVNINDIASRINKNFTHLVVLGTGGSTLTGQALVALRPAYYEQKVEIIFHDNVDPVTTQSLLNYIPLETTCVLVISKSGTTLETLSQFALFYDTLHRKLGDRATQNFLVITDPKDNPLRRIAASLDLKTLDHDPEVGGRFSIFSNVGLIPAAVAGLDVRAIRKGAHMVLADFLSNRESAPAVGAALNLCLIEKGVNTTVFMPYADRLNGLAQWVRQIWAESLGKKGKGSNPVTAMGTIDQHSQLQLYLDGPKDKLISLITLNQSGGKPVNTAVFKEKSVLYMNGKTMADIMTAEQEATLHSLENQGCLVRHFALDTLDEATLGALAMHFMLETVATAHLLKLNAFDQPAVEEGKTLARKALESVKA
ncbi:MAG: glucose-6-phosphate isomerase [Proteobacteria bacterium]|nr:glucose-6-phosphate isomerase [Pseudomonadota bacterium]